MGSARGDAFQVSETASKADQIDKSISVNLTVERDLIRSLAVRVIVRIQEIPEEVGGVLLVPLDRPELRTDELKRRVDFPTFRDDRVVASGVGLGRWDAEALVEVLVLDLVEHAEHGPCRQRSLAS